MFLGFGSLSVDYFVSDGCRVSGLNNQVFFAPLAMTTLAIMWMAIGDPRSQKTLAISATMIAASIIASTAFAETRGIFVAQMATFGVMFVFLFITGKRTLAVAVAVGAVGGFALGYLIDALSACDFTARTVKYTQSPSEAIVSDGGSGPRIRMWKAALGAIVEAPLFGHGVAYEFRLTGGPRHPHVHNIYLSWLVWGGVFSFLSGMAFLLSTMLYRLPDLFRYDRLSNVSAFGTDLTI